MHHSIPVVRRQLLGIVPPHPYPRSRHLVGFVQACVQTTSTGLLGTSQSSDSQD